MAEQSVSAAKRKRTTERFDLEAFVQAHPDLDASCSILGIDEAGRGPVIGPMIYSAACVPISHHHLLIDSGVADSKTLDEKARKRCLQKLRSYERGSDDANVKESDKVLSFFTEVVTSEVISCTMLGRSGRNLNTLSHEAAMKLIHEATLQQKGKLFAVFVDTVGPPDRYRSILSGRFPHLKIYVEKKADSKFPVVSAASVIAKTTRDATVAQITAQEQEKNPFSSIGSGYPSDGTAMAWMRGNMHRVFGYSTDDKQVERNPVRFSWAPTQQLVFENCVPVLFAQDMENDEKAADDPASAPAAYVHPTLRRKVMLRSGTTAGGQQQLLSFGPTTPKREALFTHFLGLKASTNLE